MVKAEGTSARASGSRRVYRESQADATLSVASVKQIATNVAPFGVFLALTIAYSYLEIGGEACCSNSKAIKVYDS